MSNLTADQKRELSKKKIGTYFGKEEKSSCCNARMIGGVQCEACGADGRRICKICGDKLDDNDDLVCGYHSME